MCYLEKVQVAFLYACFHGAIWLVIGHIFTLFRMQAEISLLAQHFNISDKKLQINSALLFEGGAPRSAFISGSFLLAILAGTMQIARVLFGPYDNWERILGLASLSIWCSLIQQPFNAYMLKNINTCYSGVKKPGDYRVSARKIFFASIFSFNFIWECVLNMVLFIIDGVVIPHLMAKLFVASTLHKLLGVVLCVGAATCLILLLFFPLWKIIHLRKYKALNQGNSKVQIKIPSTWKEIFAGIDVACVFCALLLGIKVTVLTVWRD
eukprot:TRINITY_DN20089_c0_g1_i1.p1 TRINITY_DN20089_c0_g1~~TRINITY_DN20089_c0_g1_i1.p1  ORF type:complete len:266 (+),score=30.08 TRINITY_DN20089_c0_g1_i1:33-830(+)